MTRERSKQTPKPQLIRFGSATYDIGREQLLLDGNAHHLDPKERGVLQQLLDAAPSYVTTEALLDQNWSNVVVGDNALHQVVARLRKLLGDQAKDPLYIETLPRTGYRLLVSPEPVGRAGPAATKGRVSRFAMATRSAIGVAILLAAAAMYLPLFEADSEQTDTASSILVAITPLKDHTPDGHLTWLADGLTEEVSHQIGQIGNRTLYSVIPSILLRTEPELIDTADLVLGGAVSSNGNEVKVTLNLVDPSTQTTTWSEQFTGANDQPLLLQQQISGAIARFFGLSVGARRWSWGPSSPEAYGPFLRYLRVQNTGYLWEQRLEALTNVLNVDPSWNTGWGDLSILWQQAITHGIPGALEHAKVAAAQAGSDAKDYSVLVARARLIGDWDGDFDAAERLLRAHNMWGEYTYLMCKSGLYAECLRSTDYFLDNVDPHNTSAWMVKSYTHTYLRQHAQAIRAVTQSDRFSPKDSLDNWWPLLWSLPALGRYEAAERYAKRLQQIRTTLPPDSVAASLATGLLGGIEWRLGRERGDAEQAQRGVDEYLRSRYHEQSGFMLLMDIQDPRTEDYLARARSHLGALRYNWISIAPFIPDAMRNHPEVIKLHQELGFTPQWRLELCRRAAQLPANSHISCDPQRYQLTQTLAEP